MTAFEARSPLESTSRLRGDLAARVLSESHLWPEAAPQPSTHETSYGTVVTAVPLSPADVRAHSFSLSRGREVAVRATPTMWQFTGPRHEEMAAVTAGIINRFIADAPHMDYEDFGAIAHRGETASPATREQQSASFVFIAHDAALTGDTDLTTDWLVQDTNQELRENPDYIGLGLQLPEATPVQET